MTPELSKAFGREWLALCPRTSWEGDSQQHQSIRIMNNRLLTSTLFGAIMFGLSACSSGPKIQYDSVQDYDFSKARTYAVIESRERPQIEIGPGTVEVIANAMKAGLEAAGLTAACAADADLLVVAHLQMTEKTDVTNWGYGYGGYRGYGYYGGTYMGGGVTTTDYKDTTLAIDVVDNEGGVLVWRGWASKDIYGDTKGALDEKQREKLKAAIAGIMANFPPPLTPED